jgi:uncharacterized protein (DUF433 family)
VVAHPKEVETMRWPVFGIENTSKLTGLSKRRFELWDRNGFFVPSLADPNRRRPGSRIYLFEEVVGLRVIARLLELGVPLRELKSVSDYFAHTTEQDWVNQRFYVGGRKVSSRKETLVPGEPVAVVSVGEVVDEVDRGTDKLSKRTDDQFGKVTRNRSIMSGKPMLAGTRIPTATIARLVEKGFSQSVFLREFLRLTPEDIEGAIRYEVSLRRNVVAN